MNDKPTHNGFIVRHSCKPMIKQLSREQKGDSLDFLMEYSIGFENGSKDKTPDDPMLSVLFAGIKTQLDVDIENYIKKATASRENGKSGGRPHKTQ